MGKWDSHDVPTVQRREKTEGESGMTQTNRWEGAQGEEFNNTCLGIPLMLCGSDSMVCRAQRWINKADCDAE